MALDCTAEATAALTQARSERQVRGQTAGTPALWNILRSIGRHYTEAADNHVPLAHAISLLEQLQEVERLILCDLKKKGP